MKGKNNHVILFVVAICIPMLLLTGCGREVSRTEFVLGTICTIRIFGGNESDLDAAFARIRQIEKAMSRHRSDSEVTKIGRDGAEGMQLTTETCQVMKKGLEYGRLSDGLFDITIAPVAELWGFETEHAAVPASEAMHDALTKVDYRQVRLHNDCRLTSAPGQRIDLGAIAKGYASDEVARLLQKAGVQRALINLGGNVFVYGKKNDGKPWKLGIQDPLEQTGIPMGTLDVEGGAVVTSGIYERFVEQDGKKYHHLLDPRTGYPIANNLAGVSITTPSGIDADALSTSLFLLGMDKGCALLNRFPDSGAVFITKDREITTCGTASTVFTSLNDVYTVVDRR
ncbi:FAD:protein FMN transferase [Desulfopila sp. IMCC35008]|uniref:FAD:protein FMN transferase n=1 Tax=Desulfopila sp. IMCC35008 TaxID=2653858 RepID=UPI0013CF9684|nr:FAD:protein FMN transferase [Desulfopila sp. IMCC35008]